MLTDSVEDVVSKNVIAEETSGTNDIAVITFCFGLGVLVFYLLIYMCPAFCREGSCSRTAHKRYEDKMHIHGEINTDIVC